MNLFSQRLKELRSSAGISQKALAAQIGITDRNYRRYEAGIIDPATSVTIALADYFDVSLDYLVGRSDDPKKY